jgi:S1-C subfamily serine protease
VNNGWTTVACSGTLFQLGQHTLVITSGDVIERFIVMDNIGHGAWVPINDTATSTSSSTSNHIPPSPRASSQPSIPTSNLPTANVLPHSIIEIAAEPCGSDASNTSASTQWRACNLLAIGELTQVSDMMQAMGLGSSTWFTGWSANPLQQAPRSALVALLQLRVPMEGIPPLRCKSSAFMTRGEPILTVSSPYGLVSSALFQNSISSGIVSNIPPPLHDSPLPRSPAQHNASASPSGLLMLDCRCLAGSEGGPVFDHDGKFVGIITIPITTPVGSSSISSASSTSSASSAFEPSSYTPAGTSTSGLHADIRNSSNEVPIVTLQMRATQKNYEQRLRSLLPTVGVNLCITVDMLLPWITAVVDTLASVPSSATMLDDATEHDVTTPNTTSLQRVWSNARRHLQFVMQSPPQSSPPLLSSHSPNHSHAAGSENIAINALRATLLRCTAFCSPTNVPANVPTLHFSNSCNVLLPSLQQPNSVHPIRKLSSDLCKSTVLVKVGDLWGSAVVLTRSGFLLTCGHVIEPFIAKSEQTQHSCFVSTNRTIWVALETFHDASTDVLGRTQQQSGNHSTRSSRHWFQADVVYMSTGPWDIALLHVRDVPFPLHPIRTGWSTPASPLLRQGSRVIAVGHALFGPPANMRPSVTTGIISRVVRLPLTEYSTSDYTVDVNSTVVPVVYQTSAHVQWGNSGGAIFDEHGVFVGIVACNIRYLATKFLPSGLQDVDTAPRVIVPSISLAVPSVILRPLIETCQYPQISKLLQTTGETPPLLRDVLLRLNTPSMSKQIHDAWQLNDSHEPPQPQQTAMSVMNRVKQLQQQLLASKL